MFPTTIDNIHEYPNAQYGVRLIFDYMVVFTSVSLARDEQEEESEDEDSLGERALTAAYDLLMSYHGIDFRSQKLIDYELQLESLSR